MRVRVMSRMGRWPPELMNAVSDDTSTLAVDTGAGGAAGIADADGISFISAELTILRRTRRRTSVRIAAASVGLSPANGTPGTGRIGLGKGRGRVSAELRVSSIREGTI